MTGRKKKTAWKNRILMIVLAFVMLFGVILQGGSVSAIGNEKKAMLYSKYAASHTIEDCVLFIGTYLIHKDVLTDELYQQAQESASEFGQMDMYYKSELANGSWFNVSDASTLADITTDGTPVEDSELQGLFVQYYMGKDGILIDVLTGADVNPFDVIDPYDLINLPELQALKLKYTFDAEADTISEEDFLVNRLSFDNGTLRGDVYYFQMMKTFFGLDMRDAETASCDAQLARLYECYKTLRAQENDEEAELVYSLMGKVDAARRFVVMGKLVHNDENAIGEIYNMAMGSYYTLNGNFKNAKSEGKEDGEAWMVELRNFVDHDFSLTTTNERIMQGNGNYENWWIPIVPQDPKDKKKKKSDDEEESEEEEDEDEDEPDTDPLQTDKEIIDAITSCMQSCQTSYNTHDANRLRDMDTVLGHAEYEYSINAINSASAAGLNDDTTKLKQVINVKEGVVKDAPGELALITSTLLPRAEAAYSTAAHAGAGPEYAAAKANNKGEAVMKAALESQKNTLEAKRMELQFLITEKGKRTDDETSLAYIYQRITAAGEWKNGVPSDDFATDAGFSVEEHIIWLQDEAERIKNGNDSLASKLDQLKEKKEKLQIDKDAALDDNDLGLAADLDAMIAAVDQDIADEEARLLAEMNDADTLGDASSALVDLGNSLDALSNRLLNGAKKRLNDKDFDGLVNSIDAMAAIGDTDGLNELKDMLEGTDAPADLINDLNDAIGDSGSGDSLLGQGDGDGNGDGSGDGSDLSKLTEDDLLAAIYGLFGDDFDLDGDVLAAIVTALSRLNEKGCAAAGRLALDFTSKGLAVRNPYFYTKYTGKASTEFVSVKTFGDVSVYRYVYNDSKQRATLTYGSSVYEFNVNSGTATHGGEQITLSEPGILSGGFYLSEKDMEEYLKCTAQYVDRCDYAVCVTEKVEKKAKQLLDLFL
ncbi:MAG: hypothetical protein K6E50_12020 [Lachnospiraceae bacterium]|nr:hypothetical protein [Lachnospiraceae bacterium]